MAISEAIERLQDDLDTHVDACTLCEYAYSKWPEGLCDRGKQLWQAIEDFEDSIS